MKHGLLSTASQFGCQCDPCRAVWEQRRAEFLLRRPRVADMAQIGSRLLAGYMESA